MNHVAEEIDLERDETARMWAVERRLFRLTCVTVAVLVASSLPTAPWRVTAGLLIGGCLSLFNYHWLKTSIAAAFQVGEDGAPSGSFSVGRYVLRYAIVAGILAGLYFLNLISIVAALLGLCSFVVALLIEASWQIVLIIFHREER